MEHIVLAYDARAGTESALQWVSRRTAGHDAVVDLLLVNNPLWADKTQAKSQLHEARDRLHHDNPGWTVYATERDGRKVQNLMRGALEADLVVMGVARRDGDTGSRCRWFPLRIASRVACPTCLVPEGWVPDDAVSRVVAGVDDDPSSDTAVAFAAGEATRLGAPLHLVHAWSARPALSAHRGAAPFDVSDIEAAHRHLGDAIATRVRIGWPSLAVELTTVHDSPVSTLAVASTHASVTVIGSHRRDVVATSFFGSVARDTTRGLRGPLIIVP